MAGVGGPNTTAAGELYLDGCGGDGFVCAWAVCEYVVSGGSGIGYGGLGCGLSTDIWMGNCSANIVRAT